MSGVQVAGFEPSKFRPLDREEKRELTQRIKNSGAKILYVGLGCPRQEVFAYEYRDHIAVPIAAYSLAGIVSASRLSARRHWVSDIFVGGSLGFLIGRYTYRHNHDPNLPGSPVSRTARLVPDIGVGGSTVALSWRL